MAEENAEVEEISEAMEKVVVKEFTKVRRRHQ